jgi:hypothetical protein
MEQEDIFVWLQNQSCHALTLEDMDVMCCTTPSVFGLYKAAAGH